MMRIYYFLFGKKKQYILNDVIDTKNINICNRAECNDKKYQNYEYCQIHINNKNVKMLNK
jgi:hypothetical protein